MKFEDISPESLKKVKDTELSALHYRCHLLYGRTKKFSKDDIVKIHVWILNEMRRRGIGYLIQDNELDRRSLPLLRKVSKKITETLEEVDLSKLKIPKIVWIPKFLAISGSKVYAKGRKPKDVDVVVRALEGEDNLYIVLDRALRLKIDRLLKARFGEDAEIEWHGTSYGSNWKHLNLFDLALVPREPLEFEEVDEPEFAQEFYKSKDVNKALSVEAKKMAEASKKEDKVRVGRFFYPLKTSLSPFEYRRGEVYGIDELVEKLKQVAQRRKLDTEIVPVYLEKKYD